MHLRTFFIVTCSLFIQPGCYSFQRIASYESIFQQLRQTSDPDARRKILESGPPVESVDVSKELVTLEAALNDPDPYIRFRGATLALLFAFRPENRPKMKSILSLVRPHVSESYEEWKGAWIQTTLNLIGLVDPESSEENLNLTMRYLFDPEKENGRTAAAVLAQLKPFLDVSAVALVSKISDPKDPGSRSVVLNAIANNRLDQPIILEAVAKQLEEGNRFNQLDALRAFREIGRSAIQYKERIGRVAREAVDPNVRNEANSTLSLLNRIR